MIETFKKWNSKSQSTCLFSLSSICQNGDGLSTLNFSKPASILKVRAFRSSRAKMFHEKGDVKNFAKLAGQTLIRRLFTMKLQTFSLQFYLKRYSGTGDFL